MLVQSSPGGGGSGVKEIIRILNERDLPALWILEYKLMGKEGYAYNDITVRAEMFQSSSAINDLQINGESLEFVLTETSIEGLMTFSDWLKTVFDLVEYHDLFENIETIEQVVNDAQIMACIETSPTARAAIAGSRAAMTAIASSQVAKDIVIGSANFMDAVAKSEVAMEVIVSDASFMNQVSTSQVAMEAIAGSKIAMYAVANSEIAMNAVNDSNVAVQAINVSPTAMWEIGHSVIAKSVSNYESTSNNIAGLSSESHAAYTAGIIDKEYIGNWTIQAANGTYMALIAADIVAMNAVINNTPAMSAVAGSATAVGAIVANAVAMNAVIISSVAMHALANSYTSMNIISINQAAIIAIVGSPIAMEAMANHEISMELIIGTHNFLTAVCQGTIAMGAIAADSVAMNAFANSTTGMDVLASTPVSMIAINSNVTHINILLNSRIAMFYLGKHNAITSSYSNYKTTHNNIISRNDSLISAYLAGWLGAAYYNDYKTLADIINNNNYLTALGNNDTLMILLNANTASKEAIVIDIAKVIANSIFWTSCCNKKNIIDTVAASSSAMNIVSANSNAMTIINSFTTAITACNTSTNAMWYIGKSSTARGVSNYTPTSSNVAGLNSASHSAYVQGIVNKSYIGNWTTLAGNSDYMTAIATNNTATSAVVASNVSMNAIAASKTSLKLMYDNSVGLTGMQGSAIAKNALNSSPNASAEKACTEQSSSVSNVTLLSSGYHLVTRLYAYDSYASDAGGSGTGTINFGNTSGSYTVTGTGGSTSNVSILMPCKSVVYSSSVSGKYTGECKQVVYYKTINV